MDAGFAREELTRKAIDVLDTNDTITCFADLFDVLAQDVQDVADLAKLSPAKVMACLIDDLEAGIEVPFHQINPR